MSQRPLHLLALAAFAALTPVAAIAFLGKDSVDFGGWAHVIGVAVGAAIATVAALALTIAGARQRDGRAVLVGCAFSVMAALLFLHGLTTPYVWFEPNGVVALTGGLTLPIGGAILALSALPAVGRPGAVRPLLWLLGVSVTAILVLALAALFGPRSCRRSRIRAAPRLCCCWRRGWSPRAALRAGDADVQADTPPTDLPSRSASSGSVPPSSAR